MDPSLHFLLAHDFQCNNWMTQGSNTNSKDDGVPWSFVFPKTSYLLSASEASLVQVPSVASGAVLDIMHLFCIFFFFFFYVKFLFL